MSNEPNELNFGGIRENLRQEGDNGVQMPKDVEVIEPTPDEYLGQEGDYGVVMTEDVEVIEPTPDEYLGQEGDYGVVMTEEIAKSVAEVLQARQVGSLSTGNKLERAIKHMEEAPEATLENILARASRDEDLEAAPNYRKIIDPVLEQEANRSEVYPALEQ